MDKEANSEHREVTAAAVSQELRIYARQRWPLENDKSRKIKLRKALELTARRIRSLWAGEATAVPRGTETARIESLIGHKIGAAAERKENDLRTSQQEYRELEARIARIEALFQSGDEEHGRPFMDGYRELALGQGGGFSGGLAGDGPERQSEPRE